MINASTLAFHNFGGKILQAIENKSFKKVFPEAVNMNEH